MSDIVERLRDGTDDGDLTIVGEQCLEAADEIERLRADLKTAFEESWKARAKVTELERELTKANERTKELEQIQDQLMLTPCAKLLAAERAVSDKLATLLTDALDSFASNLEGGEADEWVMLSRAAIAEVEAMRKENKE